MKTIPATITNGKNNNWKKGFFIKISCRSTAYFFSTMDVVIIQGSTEYPSESGQIAKVIDGKEVNPISKIRTGMKISKDGAEPFISDFTLILLNQNRIDEIIDETNLDTSHINVYLFYKNPTVSYVQVSDMLLIFSGRIDSVKKEYSKMVIYCLTEELFRHKILPDKEINKADHPYATHENIGKSIPILFGKFNNTNIILEKRNLASAICIDDCNRKYILCKHNIKSTAGEMKVFAGLSNEFAEFISNYSISKSASETIIELTNFIKTNYLIKPRKKGSQLSSDYNSSFVNAVDDSLSTSINVTENKLFYLKFEEIRNAGTPFRVDGVRNFMIYFDFGNIVDGPLGRAAEIKYFLNGTFFTGPYYYILSAYSNTTQYFMFELPDPGFWETISTMEIGFTVESGGSVEIKNMYAKIQVLPR